MDESAHFLEERITLLQAKLEILTKITAKALEEVKLNDAELALVENRVPIKQLSV